MKKVVRVIGIQDICTKLLTSAFQDVTVLLQAITYIDTELTHEVVNRLTIEQLALRITEENIQDLFRLLRIVRTISPIQAKIFLASLPVEELVIKTTVRNFPDMVQQLQTYQYSSVQLTHYVELLDMQLLALQCTNIRLQSLFWTLHALQKFSQHQAHKLLDLIPLETLAIKANVSNLGSIDQIMQFMQHAAYTPEQLNQFAELLDIDQIGQRAKQGNLRRFASFLRTLRAISVPIAGRLLSAVSPADMATLCHTQETSLADLEQLRKASTRAFWEAFMLHCSPQDIAELFQRTSLGTVGTFFYYQHTFHTVQKGYALFQAQFLPTRLATEPLNKIGEFLDRLSAIPQQGQKLAHNALILLVATDLTERIASTNLLHFALLLHNARSIDATSLPLLLTPYSLVEPNQRSSRPCRPD